MQRQINLKAIISVAILVLIVGFINTARIKHQTYIADQITAEIVSKKSSNIDQNFFNFNKTNPVIPVVSKSLSADQNSNNQNPTQNSPVSTSKLLAKDQTLEDIITADSYLVGNLATGKIYFEKNSTDIKPIASISKLLTAMVVQKNIDSNSKISIASSSVTGYEQMADVYPDETFSASDLLKGMLLISSNDAALAFANSYGYQAFISQMNDTAKSISMTKTSIIDPSGLSPRNTSSARDLFKLARYLYANDQEILKITSTPKFDLATTTEHGAHNFVNIDPFAYDPHYIGGKTGRTVQAGETMLSMFNLFQGGVYYPIAIIVLHSNQDARQIDSSVLLSWALKMVSS